MVYYTMLTGRSRNHYFLISICLTIVFSVSAITWINSPYAGLYFKLRETRLIAPQITLFNAVSCHEFINEGLLALFFLFITLVFKRQLSTSIFSHPKEAVLPILAAVGGMLLPAAIYLGFNSRLEGASGWVIPMSSDFIMVMAVLALFGKRVSNKLRAFAGMLVITDNLITALLVAVLFSGDILWTGPGIMLISIIFVFVANRVFHIQNPLAYLLAGIGLWYGAMLADIHGAAAGILAALFIPIRTVTTSPSQSEEQKEKPQIPAALQLERWLFPIVLFLVLPIFSLANAGVWLDALFIETVFSHVGLGVIVSLVLGKPLGILIFTWLALRSGAAHMPPELNWRKIIGIGCLAGAGFTLPLLASELSYQRLDLVKEAKTGILLSAITACIIGVFLVAKMIARRET